MTLIKICDVQNIYEARTIGECGADFIGLHYISKNDSARKDDVKMIIHMCHQDYPQTKSILVTKEKDVDKLIALVNEFECDGLQLHYAMDVTIIAKLRAYFGDRLLLFGVVAPGAEADEETLERVDYLIVDKSYVGGTGKKLTLPERAQLIARYPHKKLLLAGGIDARYIKENSRNDGNVAGYDIQSSVKSDRKTSYENISYSRVTELMRAAQKHVMLPATGQVGLSTNSFDQLTEYYGACDFWHFDFFDDMYGYSTNLQPTLEAIYKFSEANSHFKFQIHIFSASELYVKKIIQAMEGINAKTVEFYVHHNSETIFSFALSNGVYASLDTKDLISGSFPLEHSLAGKKIVLCMQSERHEERGATANAAMRLIRDFWHSKVHVTLDRGIVPGDLSYVLEYPVDIVSGRYLHQHKKDGYNELRRSLKNVS